MPERMIMQISAITTKFGPCLYALCDDGTVWWISGPAYGPAAQWTQVVPIPQNAASLRNESS